MRRLTWLAAGLVLALKYKRSEVVSVLKEHGAKE